MEKKPKLYVRIAEQFVRPTVFYSLIDDRYIHIIHEKDENLVGLRYFQFLLPDINQSLRNYNVLQISDRVLSQKKIITLQRNGKDNTKKVHHRVLGQGSLGCSKRIVNEG